MALQKAYLLGVFCSFRCSQFDEIDTNLVPHQIGVKTWCLFGDMSGFMQVIGNASMSDEHEIRITLRLPSELRDLLHEAGRRNARSMNGEIIARLYESFDPEAISQEFADHIQALHHSEELRAVQAKHLDAMKEWNVSLKKTARMSDELLRDIYTAVLKAAEGNPVFLNGVVDIARDDPAAIRSFLSILAESDDSSPAEMFAKLRARKP